MIPPGTYTARYWQNVPSNTWIYAKGARICAQKGNKRMVLLSNQKNGKGCHNVLIENNEFDKISGGVGSHNEKLSVVEDNPYTNVTIRNNTFKDLKGEATTAPKPRELCCATAITIPYRETCYPSAGELLCGREIYAGEIPLRTTKRNNRNNKSLPILQYTSGRDLP